MNQIEKYLPIIKKSFPDYQFSWEISTAIIVHEVAKKPYWLDIGARDNIRMKTHPGADLAVGLDLEYQDDTYIDSQTCFALGSAYNLPFKDNAFDFITSRYTFEHLEFPEKAMLEIGRVLKADGIFLLQTTNKNNPLLIIARMIPFVLKKQLLRILFKENPCGTYKTFYKMNAPSAIEGSYPETGGNDKLILEKMCLVEDILCHSKFLFTISFNLYKLLRLFDLKTLEGNIIAVFKKVR